MLNTSLTVVEYTFNSHSKVWRKYTDSIISYISNNLNGVIFVLWGNNARIKKDLIDSNKHYILESVHSSQLSATRGFFGNNHLKKKFKERDKWI